MSISSKKLHTKLDDLIRGLSNSYIKYLYKNPIKVLSVFLLITVLSLFFASKLKLITDFYELLPENTPSVKVIKKYMDRVGGVNKLLVGVETNDFDSGKKFVLDFVVEINKLPKGIICLLYTSPSPRD